MDRPDLGQAQIGVGHGGIAELRVASIEKRREFYTDHPRFGLRDVRVVELEGQVVASLVLGTASRGEKDEGFRLPVAAAVPAGAVAREARACEDGLALRGARV